jgi:hypothetical protein
MGILVSFQTGVLTSLSAPALKRWMSLMFLRSFTSAEMAPSVTRIVAFKNSSVESSAVKYGEV